MTNRYSLLVAAAAICALVVSSQAGLAHGTEPRLDVSAERASRGAPLTVQGYDFAYEDVVALMLIGSDEDWSIGTATADVEGSFTHTVVLPDDMREGEYTVSARTLHHVVESAPVLVTGLVASPGDDTGRRDQSDALAPATPSSSATTPAADVLRIERVTDRNLLPVIVIVLTVLLLGGAVAVRRAQGRRQTAP